MPAANDNIPSSDWPKSRNTTQGELIRMHQEAENDAVNHPAHYTSDPSGIECIQITQHRNFCVGNAMKYLWRAGLKDSGKTTEDLKKAVWYIEQEIKRLEGVK